MTEQANLNERTIDPGMTVSVTLPAAHWGAILRLLNFSTGIPRAESDPIYRAIEGALVATAMAPEGDEQKAA